MRGLGIAAVVLWTGCGGSPPPTPQEPPEPPAPRILNFYAAPGIVAPGDTSLLCYGVENVDEVRIDPPVRELRPALSRCIPVNPRRETTYTLHVSGPGGEASQSVTVRVDASARPAPPPVPLPEPPPQPEGPRVLSFSAKPETVAPGEGATLCFRIEGGTPSLTPDVAMLGEVPMGCFAVVPQSTTTYTLTVTGESGRTARRSVTVTVR
jgi:hypothetical protein